MHFRLPRGPRLWGPFALILGLASSASALEWVNAREGMTTFNAAAASPSTHVVAGLDGEIWSSTDGASWTKRVTPSGVNATVYGAVYGGGQFLLVGAARCCAPPAPDLSSLLMTSPDGITWTLVSTAPAGNNKTLRAVTFGSSLYVAVGDQGAILISSDATTWTAQTSGTSGNLRGVSFGGGAFVAVGDNRTVLRSQDESTGCRSPFPFPPPTARATKPSPTPAASSSRWAIRARS